MNRGAAPVLTADVEIFDSHLALRSQADLMTGNISRIRQSHRAAEGVIGHFLRFKTVDMIRVGSQTQRVGACVRTNVQYVLVFGTELLRPFDQVLLK